MTQNEVDIIKNSTIDATEAYVEARLAVADFVKTQIGVVESASKNTAGKWVHTVRCNATSRTTGIVYDNVLSVNNIHFQTTSVVFMLVPNAQFSNQFILGKLDNVPYDIVGGSIRIGGTESQPNFYVDSSGNCTCRNLTANVGGSIGGFNIGTNSLGTPETSDGCGMSRSSGRGVNLYAYSSGKNCRVYQGKITCSTGSASGMGIYVYAGSDESGHYVLHGHADVYSDVQGSVVWSGSDKRYKKDIKDLTLDFSKKLISELQPKEYEFKNKKGKRYGFIAQDVREILNKMGCKDSRLEYESDMSKDKMHQLNYTDIIAPLTMCVQDLYKQIDALKAQIEAK